MLLIVISSWLLLLLLFLFFIVVDFLLESWNIKESMHLGTVAVNSNRVKLFVLDAVRKDWIQIKLIFFSVYLIEGGDR